jgi:hypothetical protein
MGVTVLTHKSVGYISEKGAMTSVEGEKSFVISVVWILSPDYLQIALLFLLLLSSLFSYHRFYFLWYFSSGANGEPQHSDFKSQIVALSLWCVMFPARWFFVENLLNVALILFPDFFNFCLQIPWSQWLPVWQSILHPTFAEFYI